MTTPDLSSLRSPSIQRSLLEDAAAWPNKKRLSVPRIIRMFASFTTLAAVASFGSTEESRVGQVVQKEDLKPGTLICAVSSYVTDLAVVQVSGDNVVLREVYKNPVTGDVGTFTRPLSSLDTPGYVAYVGDCEQQDLGK